MGYRTTVISQHYYGGGEGLPGWFVDKYNKELNFGEHGFPISSKYERKFYKAEKDQLFLDISKVMDELGMDMVLEIALLHEDGAVDKVLITRSSTKLSSDYIGYSQIRW